MKSMKFSKKTRGRNVDPNAYIVSFEDFRGNKKRMVVKALTGAEASNRVRSLDFGIKNVSVKRA